MQVAQTKRTVNDTSAGKINIIYNVPTVYGVYILSGIIMHSLCVRVCTNNVWEKFFFFFFQKKIRSCPFDSQKLFKTSLFKSYRKVFQRFTKQTMWHAVYKTMPKKKKKRKSNKTKQNKINKYDQYVAFNRYIQ